MGTFSNRWIVSIGAAAALLVGCGAPGQVPQSSAIAARAGRVGPARLPVTSGQPLLYVAGFPSSSGTVYVYTYPQGRLVGTLTGFAQPFGECSDSSGNVFVVAYANESKTSSIIYEYAHGGTKPIAEFSDPYVASGCAVDPTTRNLAAAGAGGIAIFQGGLDKPVTRGYGYGFHFCGYDNQGNLWLSATDVNHGNEADLVLLAKGSNNVQQISLDKTLYAGSQIWPSVQWDGKHVTVTSNPMAGKRSGPILLYRLAVKGTNAKVIGTTTLRSSKNQYSGQTWIQGMTVVGAGYVQRGYQSAFIWKYPNGGAAVHTIRKIGGTGRPEVSGITVSMAAASR